MACASFPLRAGRAAPDACGFVLAAPVALAQSPHFVAASGTVNADGSLTVNFKEAGLGDN